MVRRRLGVIVAIDFTHKKPSQEGLALGPHSLAPFISNLKAGLSLKDTHSLVCISAGP